MAIPYTYAVLQIKPGSFFPSFAVLSTHENVENWKTVFQFIHSYSGGNYFKFFMGDGVKAITQAWSEVSFFYRQSNIWD